MAVDPRKRQKQLARKKAKHQSNKANKQTQALRAAGRALEAAGTAPILHAFVSDNLWDQGLGYVILSRTLPGGQVAHANFMLDIFCLGVKDAYFDIGTPEHYRATVLEGIGQRFNLVKIEPAAARKLVEGGVDYAASFGLSPHPDYAKAKRIFGDIDPSECEEEFEYGKDGHPLFIQGPYDSPEKVRRIMLAIGRRQAMTIDSQAERLE